MAARPGDDHLVTALDVLPVPAVLVDSDACPVWANRAALGLTATDTSLDSSRLLATIGSSEPVKEALVDRVTARGTVRLPTDVAVLEREVTASPIAGTDFVVATFAGVGEPAAESHAREVLSRLEVLLEHTTDIITVLDASGVVQFSNAAAGRLTGLTGAAVNGLSAFDLVHPDDVERAASRLAAASERPEEDLAPIEIRVRFGDGQWHDVEVSLRNLLGVPPIDGLVVTMHDVTERKAMQARLESLVANLTDIVVLLDRNFEITYVTAGISNVIEAAPETNLGMSALNDIHPDDLPLVGEVLASLVDQPLGATIRVELRLEQRPGSERWRWVEATAVNRLDDPAVESIVVTLRDVTEQKAAAEELRAAYERERANVERLRELDRLKDDFLSTVSHELRTPLAAIVGFSDLLQRDELPEHLRGDLVGRIAGSAGDMRAMIDNVLDFSALEAGKVTLDQRPVRVADAIEATLTTVEHQVRAHRVDVEADGALMVMADSHGLGHVLRNLVTNAAKYSPPGAPITIRAYRQSENAVAIEVTDTGQGIDPALQEQIFERFFRAPGAAFSARGSGVGLNIVKRYVELMGGAVALQSSPGQGSTFTVTLPAA